MTLYDMMMPGMAHQIYHVYVGNMYDQNEEIGHGRRRDIMNEDVTAEGIDHLMDTIDHWYVAKDGSVVVVLRDEHFEELVENRYDTEYVVKWDPMNPDTRPWKHSCELEKML